MDRQRSIKRAFFQNKQVQPTIQENANITNSESDQRECEGRTISFQRDASNRRVSLLSMSSNSGGDNNPPPSRRGRLESFVLKPDTSHRLNASMYEESSSEDYDSKESSSINEHPQRYEDRPWFIILPSNKYRVGWDMFIAILLMTMAFYVPFRVCMYWDSSEAASRGIFFFEIAVDAMFGIDIILNFITAYYDREAQLYICDPKKIIIRYLRGFFIIDFLASFPFGLVITPETSIDTAGKIGKLGKLPRMMRLLKAVRLLKLLRMYKIKKIVFQLESEFHIHHGITRIIKIVSAVIMVTHLSGCFWHLVGLSGGDDIEEGGWIYRYSYEDKTIPVRYIASLYWAFSTLTTVGYGDISARTSLEQIYAMVTFLLGVSWYAFVVSSISQVMQSFDSSSSATRDKMICVNQFIRAARLPKDLEKKIREYFEFRMQQSQQIFLMKDSYDAEEILAQLSSALRAEVFMWIERDLVSAIPFFDGKSPQFIADALHVLKPVIFHEGEFIVEEGSQADEMFFFESGKAAIYYGEKIVATLGQGDYFGEIGCLVGGIRRASAKALSTCKLHSLSRRNLFTLIADHPGIEDDLKRVANNRENISKKHDTEKRRMSVVSKSFLVADKNNKHGSMLPLSPNSKSQSKVKPPPLPPVGMGKKKRSDVE